MPFVGAITAKQMRDAGIAAFGVALYASGAIGSRTISAIALIMAAGGVFAFFNRFGDWMIELRTGRPLVGRQN